MASSSSSLAKQDTMVLDKKDAASSANGDADDKAPSKFVSVQSHKFMSVDLRFMSGDEEGNSSPAMSFQRMDGPSSKPGSKPLNQSSKPAAKPDTPAGQGSKTPASKTPVSKTPASKTPVSKTPISKTPVSKTPVSKTPVSKTPTSKSPASKTPTTKTPTSKTPMSKTPTSKNPADKTLTSKTSSKNPADKTPSSKTPVGKISTSNSSVQKSASKTPATKTSSTASTSKAGSSSKTAVEVKKSATSSASRPSSMTAIKKRVPLSPQRTQSSKRKSSVSESDTPVQKRQRKKKAIDYDDIIAPRSPARSPARSTNEGPSKASPAIKPAAPKAKPESDTKSTPKAKESKSKAEATPNAEKSGSKSKKATPKPDTKSKATPHRKGRSDTSDKTATPVSSRRSPTRRSKRGAEDFSPGPSKQAAQKTATPKGGSQGKTPKVEDSGSESEDPNPLRYKRKAFLAIRNEENGFYMCWTCQNVYELTKKWKVYWMNEVEGQKNRFRFEYVEWLLGDYSCVISEVKMKKIGPKLYEMTQQQRDKIEAILSSALSGKPRDAEEDEEEEEEDMSEDEAELSDEDEERQDDDTEEADTEDGGDTYEPPKKKTKSASTDKAEAQKKQPAKVVASKAKKTSPKGKKSEEAEKKRKEREAQKAEREAKKAELLRQKEERRKRLAMQKRMSNSLLKARASVKLIPKDPLLETRDPMPFVSSSAYSKLVLRAVYQEDVKLLKAYINDTKQVSAINMIHSVGLYRDAVQMAMERGNKELLETILKEVTASTVTRAKPTQSVMSAIGTGSYNFRSLGVRNIQRLCQSRGTKEGNNALLKDLQHSSATQGTVKYIKYGLQLGVDLEILNLVLLLTNMQDSRDKLYDNLWLAVRFGHRKLAGQLVKEQEDTSFSQFNALHRDVLLNDKEDLKIVRAPSVRKKPYENMGITPIHCAAINPNVKYLQKLLSVVPEYTIMDQKQRRPIHYAVACEGKGPLEFLLKRGMDPNEMDSMGYTPLHVACETGREHNVRLLLERAKAAIEAKDKKNEEKEEDDEEGEESEEEFTAAASISHHGVGGINRPVYKPQNRYHHSYTPLHLAVEKEHIDVVRTLLRFDADMEKELGAGKEKKTPLAIAAARGNLDIVRLLVTNGAKVEARDRMKRTPLMHAIMSGHTHVASFLVSLGANTSAADSSNNTVVHYASAYGWYFCLKMLIESKADCSIANDWKMTPLGIAFMKGHAGLADMLLKQPNVDINFKDDQGMTLVAIACSSPLTEGIVEQLEYLVNNFKADCTVHDLTGKGPLHHLAMNSVKIAGSSWDPVVCPKAVERSLKIAELLIDQGCDPSELDVDKQSPLMYAVEQANVPLVKFLVEKGAKVTNAVNKTGKNVLHLMAEQCMQHKLKPLIVILSGSIPEEVMKEFVNQADHNGFTPLLRACQRYADWNGSKQDTPPEINNQSEPEEDEEDDEDKEEDEEPEDEEEEQDMAEEDDMDDAQEPEEEEMEQDEEEPMEEDEEEEEDEEKDEDLDESKVEDDDIPLPDESTEDSGEKKKVNAAYIQWQDSRDFIEALITLCGADVNSTVQYKHLAPGNKLPEKEEDRYIARFGGQGVLHLLNSVNHELPLVDEEDETPTELTPCLSMLLSYKPDMDEYDVYGQTPLLHAISKAAYTHGALKLIQSGADVSKASKNEKDDALCTPLLMAVLKTKLGVVKELLKHKDELDIEARDKYGNTAVHYATTKAAQIAGNMSLLNCLLDVGAVINAVNSKKRTPLHLAVNDNHGGADATAELPEHLIGRGADVFALDCRGRLPLHYVFVKIGKHTDTSACDPIELCSTLTATMNGKGVDDKDDFEQTPLHRAALRGATVCCMHLIQKGANIQALDSNGNTPLGMAVFQEHESCTIMLLQQKANLKANIVLPSPDDSEDQSTGEKKKPEWKWKPLRDSRSQGPLVYPIFQSVVYNEWQGVTYMMLDLLEEHAIQYMETIKAAFKTHKFNLALTLARKQMDVAKLKTVDDEERNLLHWLALAKPNFATELQERMSDVLIKHDVDVMGRDKYGCIPLTYASLHRNVTVALKLLESCGSAEKRKAMTSSADKFGRNPLLAFFWNMPPETESSKKLLGKILEHTGASLDQLCDFPLPSLSLFGYHNKDAAAATHTYFTHFNGGHKVSPLILAVRNKDFATAKTLLQLGADVNYVDAHQMTPLMHAVKMNDLAIVKLLLNHDYDPVEEAKKEAAEAASKKVNLVREHSRRLFTLGQLNLAQLNGDVAAAGGSDKAGAGDQEESMDVDGETAKDKKKAEEEEKKKEEETEENMEPDDIFLNFKAFPCTSRVKLDQRDQQGWCAIHHLVCPLEYGTYDNVQLLALLANAGASITAADSAGLTPLDYAFIRGAPALVKAIQKLMARPKADWERPSFSATAVKDSVEWTDQSPDYRADAESLLKQQEALAADNTSKTYKPEPDSCLDIQDTCDVVEDESLGMAYDTLLTKIDIQQRSWGLYNFYKMQIVYQKAKEIYVLMTRWGRIGDSGQYQQTPFPNRDEAVKEFNKIFRAKTGNKWADVKSFVNKEKKYRLVELEDRAVGKKLHDVELDLQSPHSSRLPPYVQDLVKTITDQKTMMNAICRIGLDDSRVPFSRLKKSAINKAKDVLAQIKPLIEEKDEVRRNLLQAGNQEKYHNALQKIYSLSNDYFHLIPEAGYSYEKVEPIDNMNRLNEKWKNMTTLLELECASRIIVGAQHKCKDMNPLDYIYRCLNCQLELMNEEQVEAQYLMRYVYATSPKSKVEAIYRVARHDEEKRLQACELNNHVLLFHGSSTSNLLSILKQGLRVAPPEAPTTGYSFGKGIYTADKFTKSLSYCYNFHGELKTKFMLVCEVALGRPKVETSSVYVEKPEAGYDSVIGQGSTQPNPEFDVTLPSGARMPLGLPVAAKDLKDKSKWYSKHRCYGTNDSEFIVFSESQVCIRYIIQFE